MTPTLAIDGAEVARHPARGGARTRVLPPSSPAVGKRRAGVGRGSAAPAAPTVVLGDPSFDCAATAWLVRRHRVRPALAAIGAAHAGPGGGTMAEAATDPSGADPVAGFQDAMACLGIVPRQPVRADGKLHRFDVDGDRPGSRNGFYVLHLDDRPAGLFGCHKRGIKETWKAGCACAQGFRRRP